MLLFLLAVACVHHVPAPGSAPTSAPDAGPASTSDVTVCWVEYATGSLPHGTAVAHGALRQDVESTQSGLLFKSSLGNWLIDGGQAADVKAELKDVKGLAGLIIHQAAAGWTVRATPAQALLAAGVGEGQLAGAIPTHAHFDHLGGLLDLGVPVLLPQAEIDLAKAVVAGEGFGVLPREAVALLPRAKPLAWTGGPVLYWDESFDLYGDGTVVLFPLPGHTPGSLGVRVRVPSRPGTELLLVGDTVWVREGYEQREPKGWLAAGFDDDADLNDQQIGKLWQLHQARPDLHILPAHDRRAWVEAFGVPGC